MTLVLGSPADSVAAVAPAGARTRAVLKRDARSVGQENTGVLPAESWRSGLRIRQRRAVTGDVVVSAVAGALPLAWGVLPMGAGALWCLALACSLPAAALAFGAYRWRTLGEGAIEYRGILRAGGALAVLMFAVAYVGIQVPLAVVGVALPAALAMILIGRLAVRRHLLSRRAVGEACMRTIVVGPRESVERIVARTRRVPSNGLEVVGWVTPGDEGAAHAAAVTIPGTPWLGQLGGDRAVEEVLVAHAVDVVLVAGDCDETFARRLSPIVASAGASLVVVPSLAEIAHSRVRVRPTDPLWCVQLDVLPRRLSSAGKLLLDRVGGTILFVVSLLVLLPAAVAVRATSPGPAFYKQQRVGRGGRLFTMWKLRSMYIDAEARRAALVAQNEGNGLLFKMKDDPRVTALGRILRRFSVDELPQLINVVRGEMALIGPRPALPDEVARYTPEESERLLVKPGLTGLWQVSGRSDLSREDSMLIDRRYVDNLSFTLDATILAKTAGAVIGGHGAY